MSALKWKEKIITRTTAILNQKGGVGKTITTVNMAAILAADYHKSVLVIDADAQANTTEFFEGDAGHGKLSDLLRWQADARAMNLSAYALLSGAVQPANVDGVDLIAADESLMDLDLSSVTGGRADPTVLRHCLHAAPDRLYDYVLIDCPPCFNAASAAALLAADDVIIPIKIDAFSLRGMANISRQIKNMQEINPALRVAGLLPTMTYKSDKIAEALKILRLSDFPVFTPIRRTGRVDDMTFARRPLRETSPRSAACVDYRRFVKQYMKGDASRG